MPRHSPDTGKNGEVVEVRVAPDAPMSFTTLDAVYDGSGDDHESVLFAEPERKMGEGDSSSCHSDLTRISSDAPRAECGQASLEAVLEQTRRLTVLKALETLQSLEPTGGDIKKIAGQVARRAMEVLRLWLTEKAHVPTSPAQFSPVLREQIDRAVRQATQEVIPGRFAS